MLLAAVFAASCVLPPHPDPTRFYVLAASVPDSPHPPGPLAIGLGPIAMPGYLQRPGLATRVGAEIHYADCDRWAEALPTLFARALGQDLSALLGARVVPYPWYRVTPLDVVMRMDVTSFEADAAGSARLDVCWTVRDSPTERVCREDCSSIVETVDARGAAAQVAALGRAVDELARRVASAIPSCRRTFEPSAGNRAVPPLSRGSGSQRADAARDVLDIPAASIQSIAGKRE